MEGQRKRVVIIGGGFAGLTAAKALRKALVDVTLVDRVNHHLFQPLLYQVATATLSPADVAMPIRHILRKQANLEVLLGEVDAVDTAGNTVSVKDLDPIRYDFLIVATGATHSYFGHPQWEKYARGLKTIEDATYLRGEVLAAFEFAERSHCENEREEWMTFILVGAGPTGVEMAGAISELSHHVIKGDYRHIDPTKAKIVLVEAGDRILSAYPKDLSEKARKSLTDLYVDVRLNSMVQGIDDRGVTTSAGRIEGRTVIWTAGVQASPAAKWLNAQADKSGRVKVNPDLTVPGLEHVYVVGDCAYFEQDGHPLPGVAQVAIQMGKFAGDDIANRNANKPGKPVFRYKDLGSLATIGRSSAVAQFGKVHLYGWVAWWIWLFVHIMKLVGFRNRVSVLVQWAWAYFTWDRGARIITKSDCE